MTSKAKRAQYTLEFKLEAVRLVKAGQSIEAVAATLGVVEQTLYNWVKAERKANWRGRREACEPGTDGSGAAACGSGSREDGAKYFKKSVAAYFSKESM